MSTKRKLQQQRILGIFDELTKGWETAPDELTKAKETLQNIIEKDQDYVKLSEHARNSEEYPPANNLVDTLFVLYNKCLNDVNNNATLKHTPEQIIALFEDLVVPQRPVVLCCSVKDGTSQVIRRTLLLFVAYICCSNSSVRVDLFGPMVPPLLSNGNSKRANG